MARMPAVVPSPSRPRPVAIAVAGPTPFRVEVPQLARLHPGPIEEVLDGLPTGCARGVVLRPGRCASRQSGALLSLELTGVDQAVDRVGLKAEQLGGSLGGDPVVGRSVTQRKGLPLSLMNGCSMT
jgi:hypothetical protein